MHYPLRHDFVSITKKNCVWLILALEPIFACRILFSDYFGQISSPDKIFQNSWPQTFDKYIFSLCTFFAQCHFLSQFSWLNVKMSTTSEKWELRIWKLGQIFKIKMFEKLRYYNKDGFLVTLSMFIFSSRLLKKIFESKIKACPSLGREGW